MQSVVQRLTENPEAAKLDHKNCLRIAATKLDKFRNNSDENTSFNMEELKVAIEDSDDEKSFLQQLWGIRGLREYFKSRESSTRLEELMLVSALKGPLTEFPPDINKNAYAEIIDFGIDKCPDVILMILDLIVKKGVPVQEKDVLRVSFFFSMLAHGTSRHNDTLTKVKSLLLSSQGLTGEGLDLLSFLGVCQTSRSTLNSTDLLAEVSDSLIKESAKTMASQSTVDNLDYLTTHMTSQFKEFERQDTSHLSTEEMEKSEVKKLFNLKQVLIDDESHKAELDHILKIAANTVGRLLGQRLKHLKVLTNFLPLHYKHQNSELPKQPANIMIMKLEGLQETVNSEMVEYLDKIQMEFLLEVAEGAPNKIEYLEDIKVIQDKDVSSKDREEAEERVKKEVKKHGSWIGHGDLLTVKMFYTAKSLR